MRFAMLLVLVAPSCALAQDKPVPTTSGNYRLTGPTPSAQGYQELLTVLRVVADAREVKVDSTAGTMAFSGSGDAPEMSDWLLRQLDRAPGTPGSDPPEFHSAGKDDNICVFYLAHTPEPLAMQEILTILRTVADVLKVFGYSPLNALAVRGTAAQIELVKGLVQSLDKNAPIAAAEVPQFAVGGTPDLVRVYYVSHATTRQDMDRITVALRTTGGISRTFASAAKGAVVVRGRPEQMAKAEGIVLSMDRQLAR